jgi:flagellar assembly protein FliH
VQGAAVGAEEYFFVNSPRPVDLSPAAVVLRGIRLHSQPHALKRPVVTVTESLATTPPSGLDQLAASDVLESEAASHAAYEAGFADGRKQGFVAGQAAATAEGARALRAALEETRAQAAIEGRLEGLAKGRDEGHAQASQVRNLAQAQADEAARDRLDRLDRVLQAVIAQTAQQLEQAEDDLVALSHEAVCRILGTQAAQPERLRSMVAHLLAQHGLRAQLAVHVHPDDLAALLLEAGQDGERPWRWVGDSAVQLGGVVLRSPEGSLDARLETQLAALGETLLAVRRNRKAAAESDAVAAPAVAP